MAFSLSAQVIYQTNIHHDLIKTLQVKVAGESLSNPIIAMQGGKQIEINFDAMTSGYQHYAYSLIHCDADWKQSTLSPIEYVNGFQGLPIESYANSMGTTIAYSNYKLYIPNEDIQLKVSGNYAVRVYNEDNPEETVLTACFSVVEPKIVIASSVSSNTNIDTNQSHQQVSFRINTRNFQIPHPQTDLKIWVYQNNRRDNAITGFMPMQISNTELNYSHIRELIFKAGNEYRRTEFLSTAYNGMHVENISFHNPYYHVTLYPDIPRSHRSYQYDQDQDGRFLIHCNKCNDPDTEADYQIVHFTLVSDYYTDGDVYLSGELFHNVQDEKSKMEYNHQAGQYEKSVLLKQGHYNYQYLFVPRGESRGETALLEGDYYETENEYSIYVYYRPMGERYDRLIGISTLKLQ